jgi:hypothetical protein
MAVGGIGGGAGGMTAPSQSSVASTQAVPPPTTMSNISPTAPISAPPMTSIAAGRNLGSALARDSASLPISRMAQMPRSMPPLGMPISGQVESVETEARAPGSRFAAPRPQPEQAPQQLIDPALEEPQLPPRQIPAHLQQPLRPMPQLRPAARGPEPRAEQRAATKLNAAPEAPPSTQPRKSLFSIVTGAIRGNPEHEMQPAPVARVEPIASDYASEPPRAASRHSGTDDIGIEIPAFLRRQN